MPLLAIVGRPNVGKSTLFNRLVGRRRSIVTDEPGITRDRIYGRLEWGGRQLEVVDTGGLLPHDEDVIAQSILKQARTALQEAAQVLLVTNFREGVVPLDEELAHLLRPLGKPLALVVNKVDSPQQVAAAGEFHRLGIEPVFFISAEHSHNITEMLDVLFSQPHLRPGPEKALGEQASSDQETSNAAVAGPEEEIRVAIMGRPNVGKSTLLNNLCGKERAIVSPLPGTTRDSVDALVEREGQRFRLVDTAGIRRKGKTKLIAEKLSVVLARKHLEQSEVALLLIDAVEGITALDATIAGYAHDAGKSLVLVVNKWDLAKKTPDAAKRFEASVRRRAKFLEYAPVVFISALTGQRVTNLMQRVVEVARQRRRHITTGELNRFFQKLDIERATVPMSQRAKIFYATQTRWGPPTFVLFTNRRGRFHFGFERFLINRIREHFGFEGTPIRIEQRIKKGRSSAR